jgi:hypothetical protein
MMAIVLNAPAPVSCDSCGLERKATDLNPTAEYRFSLSGTQQLAAAACFCLTLFLPSGAAMAAAEDDLKVMFRGDRDLPPPGGIAGTVTNSSARQYDCIDIVFRLVYKGGAGDGPAEQRVRLENLSPRSVTNYSAPLQSKAGFGLQGIELCSAQAGENPPQPSPQKDCTVTGQVRSTMSFEGIGDTGHSEKIERVFLLTPDGKLVSEEPLSARTTQVNDHRTGETFDSREFSFARLPANLSYVVQLSNAWKTTPAKLTFRCPDSQGRHEFGIGPLEHIGNRLGG